MDLPEHLEALRESLATFVDVGRRAGLDAEVPTAPDWTLRQLVAHTGMVHRWATACLLGQQVDEEALERQGLDAEDPVLWLHEGGLALLDTLESVPDDVVAPVFLKDAPAPKRFWARRQCHETTIHAVDALAAALGRVPTAADTWIGREVALDGIDELLTGFAPRSRFGLRVVRPTSFAVRPTDATRTWLLRAGKGPTVTEREPGHRELRLADVTLQDTAVELYLALWNRSDEVYAEGFEQWQASARVVW